METIPQKHTKRAITLMGGVAETVRKLGLNGHATVYQWTKTKVPAERCPQIEAATGGQVCCEDLRPDVQWSVLRGTADPIEKAPAAPVDALRADSVRRLAERRSQSQRTQHERRAKSGPPYQAGGTGVA